MSQLGHIVRGQRLVAIQYHGIPGQLIVGYHDAICARADRDSGAHLVLEEVVVDHSSPCHQLYCGICPIPIVEVGAAEGYHSISCPVDRSIEASPECCIRDKEVPSSIGMT